MPVSPPSPRAGLDLAAGSEPSPEPSLILWDLVGSCNLKCPSCPMGNMREASGKGFIDEGLFRAILGKLRRDFASCRQLHFYNWTEPLLHPRIAEFCREAAAAGFHVHLSSNLNHLRNAREILASGIKTFRISLSGFTQATYAIGHRGGRIDKVKANMRELADARRVTGARTRIHVYFHKYRHNLDELPRMQALAHELGFEFLADWAFLMPLEKLLAVAEGTAGADDAAFADAHLAPHPVDALRAMRPQSHRPCSLIEQLVLDHRGRASLCCATFDPALNNLGDYLQLDWRELQRLRYAQAMCARCTRFGAHVLYTSVSDPVLRGEIATLAESAARGSGRGQAIRHPINLPLPIAEVLAKSA